MNEFPIRKYNGSFNVKTMSGVCPKLRRKAAVEPVYVDMEGADEIPQEALQHLLATCSEIGETRCRIIGISRPLWNRHIDLWTQLGAPIVVPPLWTEETLG